MGWPAFSLGVIQLYHIEVTVYEDQPAPHAQVSVSYGRPKHLRYLASHRVAGEYQPGSSSLSHKDALYLARRAVLEISDILPASLF